MNPDIESTRFGRYCINVYFITGASYLVCGSRDETGSGFTRPVFQHCRRPPERFISTLQRQLRALETTRDFRRWYELVYSAPWDPNCSQCPLCFVQCQRIAEELRRLMGAEYDPFLAGTLKITVGGLPPEAEEDSVGTRSTDSFTPIG